MHRPMALAWVVAVAACTGQTIDEDFAELDELEDPESESDSEPEPEPEPASDPGECRSLRLIDGAPDDRHAWGVGICNTDDPVCTKDTGQCSGTLVAPNLVLTARHCVDRGRQLAQDSCDVSFLENTDPDTLQITTHADPYNADDAVWYGAEAILVPNEGNTLCTYDIALVVLESNIPEAEAVPASVDLTNNVAESPPCAVAVIGRGVIDTDLVPLPGGAVYPETVDDGDYRRRITQSIPVLCVSDEEGACTIDDVTDPTGEFTSEPAQIIVGPSALPGDSGAGMIDQNSLVDGAPRVVAVAHAGTHGEDDEPNSSLGIRVDWHAEFLRQGAAHAALRGSYPLPAWAQEG